MKIKKNAFLYLRSVAVLGLLPILVVFLFLFPVLFREGWPYNHEDLSWKARIAIYSAHFLRGDFFVVWSESVADGYGGPFPIYYHKLFYVVAGVIYSMGASIKVTVLSTLGLFTGFGLLGMRRFLRIMGIGDSAGAIFAAASFLFTNYVYTLWLVRGAFAEFSAVMLLPWVFLWCAELIRGSSLRKILILGGWVFPALYFAHSLIFFFLAFPSLGAVGIRMVGGLDRLKCGVTCFALGCWFFLLVAPVLLLQNMLGEGFNFREGVGVFHPSDFFYPWFDFFTGGSYVWGRAWEGHSVELDRGFVAGALIGGIFLISRIVRRSRGDLRSTQADLSGQMTRIWIIISVFYFAFLMTPFSRVLYDYIPGFALLQFPWRILGYLTVLLPAIIWCALNDAGYCRHRTSSLTWGLTLALIAFLSSPWLARIQYGWFSQEHLNAPIPPDAAVIVGGLEYHPVIEGVASGALQQRIRSYEPHPSARTWRAEDWSVERVDVPAFESGRRSYQIEVARESAVLFPIAYSPYISVKALGEELPAFRLPDDPRLRVVLPEGSHLIEIQYPTLWNILF